ncbi:3-methyl-2-oxobutanoate hydroxymethyltransferase [Dokdonella immobilis]|uniref:3-methyl-2-oxobutanoate hydroxymethyltransferase n=1 Tax=Dokdonella immobilis TaxID=578942 RepID=A0A1I4WKU9_9GAMM|nr:3-methyl-2-oxobutanoate hydroxymethyltransferase [Dokdonella immobilis]SFN13903.1 ketopantoate hydroxymethyltransferase [Dokdonella immobilis]
MYSNSTSAPDRAPITVPALQQRKPGGDKIVALTCYDASFAAHLDAAGVDVVLVGDSLGMVIQGLASTLPVSVDDMVYHTAAVARGMRAPLLVADMPFMSYRDVATAMASATRLIAEGGASMVKLEGGAWTLEVIEALVVRDIPVCAHLGLTPQSVHRLGGYKVQGKLPADAARLLADAHAVAGAGAQMLVLECVPTALAEQITREIAIPTIGIGAGPGCDGQVLVLYDLLGITPGRRPRFSKDFLRGHDSIDAALVAYVQAVRQSTFPGPEHSY